MSIPPKEAKLIGTIVGICILIAYLLYLLDWLFDIPGITIRGN